MFPSEYSLDKYMTKYEKTRVLGQRADQISRGAPPMVDVYEFDDAMAIAERELQARKIPLKVRRTYPNGDVREYMVADLEYD